VRKLLIVGALASISAMAADWTGYIIDKNCASKKEMWGNEACAQACIKRGAPAVLVMEDGKVYAIAEQDKVKDLAGKKVTVTGTMKNDTISVESVNAM
jgi:predicted transcriptional regulator